MSRQWTNTAVHIWQPRMHSGFVFIGSATFTIKDSKLAMIAVGGNMATHQDYI